FRSGARCVDPVAGGEPVDIAHRLVEKRRIGRVRAELVLDQLAKTAPRGGDQHQPANLRRVLRRDHRHEPALAVAEHPDAACAGLFADRRGPAVHIAGIVGDRDVVGVGDRRRARENPRLSTRTLAMPRAASPSASNLWVSALSPCRLLPSRLTGPEPGMISTTGGLAAAGISMTPLSGPDGPGASTIFSTGSAIAVAPARTRAARVEITVLALDPW